MASADRKSEKALAEAQSAVRASGYMNRIFLKITGIIMVPFIINVILSRTLIAGIGDLESAGFHIGALTSFSLSLVWLVQVRISLTSAAPNLMKVMMRAFLVKMVFLVLCIVVSHLYFEYDRRYFIISFLIGTILSLLAEVWFYLVVNKAGKSSPAEK